MDPLTTKTQPNGTLAAQAQPLDQRPQGRREGLGAAHSPRTCAVAWVVETGHPLTVA